VNSAQFQSSLRQVAAWSLAGGALFALLSVGAALLAPARFYPAWLVAFLFWLGLSLGSLALSMLHHLTGGGWGIPIRRIIESAAAVFVPMALLFVPIVIGMHWLYPWTDEAAVAKDVVLSKKTQYLDVDFFLARAAVYFVIWALVALALNRATATADLAVQDRRRRGLAMFSGVGLVLWALTVTFASIDWGMSIEPHWFSSMYPVLYMGGQAVSAFSLAVIAATLLRRFAGPNVLTTARLHDLGNFLLAFVMFWSYVSFMQFLIIWSGNLPEESPWYLLRGQGGWQVVAASLMLLHFLLPFFLLLMRRSKRAAPRLAGIAGLLLFMRLVDLSWLIFPPFVPSLIGGTSELSHGHGGSHAEGATTSVLDLWPLLVTLPAVGGIWLAMFCFRLSVRGVIPVNEPVPSHEAAHARAQHAAH
jgi:hypothetical protein